MIAWLLKYTEWPPFDDISHSASRIETHTLKTNLLVDNGRCPLVCQNTQTPSDQMLKLNQADNLQMFDHALHLSTGRCRTDPRDQIQVV